MNRPERSANDAYGDSDGDGDWLDALAGRGAAVASAATHAEAQLWRQAQLRAAASEPALVLPDVQQLLDRARAEGLLQPRRRWCAGCVARWQRWMGQPLARGGAGLALASVLVALVVVGLQPSPDDAPAMRGGAAAITVRAVDDPVAAREQVVRVLRSFAVQPRTYERLGRWGLDADLPHPLPPALQQALQAQGLAAPAGPTLRVEFEERRP